MRRKGEETEFVQRMRVKELETGNDETETSECVPWNDSRSSG